MSRMSAIEKWFYGLAHLEGSNAPQRRFSGQLRTETNPFKPVTTRTTTIASLDRAHDRAMGVKMVADELLAATGTVIGATSGFFAFAAAPNFRTTRLILQGAQTGETIGRNLGSFMWSIIN